MREKNQIKPGASRIKHGDAGTPEYRAWKSMKDRCSRPTRVDWKRYGGRGISVCPEWINSYPTFLEAVGRRPSKTHSLDRIDTNGNYEPGNVRWATSTVQARNTRRNRLLTAFGETLSVAEWAERTGISQYTLHERLKLGWRDEDTITVPVTPIGSNRSNSKLTPDNVIAVMARLLIGESQVSVARFYNVHVATINDIWQGKTWKHLIDTDQLQGQEM